MPKHFGRLAAILFFLAALSCFLTAAAGPSAERTTRLIVGVAIAGLAAAILFFEAFLGGVEKVEPVIVTLCEPIKMIGLSLRRGVKMIFRGAAKPGQEDKKVKEKATA